MKQNFNKLFLTVPLLLLFIFACKKEEGIEPIIPTDNSGWTISSYLNQSSDPNANSLHAQLRNDLGQHTINIYGTFDANGYPETTSSVTYKKDGNDTLVCFKFNEQSNKLETAYTEVNGVKQRYVIKHSYLPNNDSTVQISIYDYNWANNTAELLYDATYRNSNNSTQTQLNYLKSSFSDYLSGISAGIIIAEACFYGSGVGILGSAAGAAIIGAAGTIIVVGAAAVIIVGAIAIISGNANASEPNMTPYPNNTPVPNPVINTNPNLPSTPCLGFNLTFNSNMDLAGSVAITNVQGGQSGYFYSIDNSPFQNSQIFNGPYQPGGHLVMIKDNGGCVNSEIRSFTPSGSPTISTSSVTIINGNSVNSGGNVTNNNGSAVTSRGVCYSTSSNPTINNPQVLSGSGNGSFTVTVSSLTPNTTYYLRAFATNSQGTTYGEERIFTTPLHWIGQSFGGGIVFYIHGNGTSGLISATSDQSTFARWHNGNPGILTNALGTAIGTGSSNTNTIVNLLGAGPYAASICYDLTLNNYSDWYLPSKDELYLLMSTLYMNGLGNFSAVEYWSSSEIQFMSSWSQDFSNGLQNQQTMDYPLRVRAVRSF
jgi:hypothetical protein